MTLSNNVSFPVIAKGFGYTHVCSTDVLDEFKSFLTQSMEQNGSVFIHLKTRPGVPAGLGRPSVKPVQVKERFMEYLGNFQ
jgi:phosphonopyruvate decarboxylase